jgi:hypothetical protein
MYTFNTGSFFFYLENVQGLEPPRGLCAAGSFLTDCDTTSRIFGLGKRNVLQKLLNKISNKELAAAADMFLSQSPSISQLYHHEFVAMVVQGVHEVT